MRFALLGDHRDGLDFACALAESGRHQVYLYHGSAAGLAHLQRHRMTPRTVADLEEILADADLDAVIVAGAPRDRSVQLRRAMQSECHVLCVHPADQSPNIAFEAAMIQGDTGRVLLPLLPTALHPGIARAAQLARTQPAPRILELEIWSQEEMLLDAGVDRYAPGLPAWDILRAVGGEIVEVSLQAPGPEHLIGQPLLLFGKFASGMLFRAAFLPNQAEIRWQLSLVTTTGRASLSFPDGWPGPASWTFSDEQGAAQTEDFPPIHPWLALIHRFEQAVEAAAARKPQPGQPMSESLTRDTPVLGWEDELRALELDDAARRSAERGKSSTLDLQETTEEASFKGTMTLVGCSLIWLALILLIASVWLPWLAWIVIPVFGVFLLLQALRWIVPSKDIRGFEANDSRHDTSS